MSENIPFNSNIQIFYCSSSSIGPDFRAVMRRFTKKIRGFPKVAEMEKAMRSSTVNVLTIIFASENEKIMIFKHLREVERFINSQDHIAVKTLVLLVDFAPQVLIAEIRSFGAEALSLRPIHNVAENFIGLLVWQLQQPERLLPVIRFLYRGTEEALVSVIGRLDKVDFTVKGRLLDLFEALDRRWKTKKELAERSGISISNINEYIRRLRKLWNIQCRDAGVNLRGKRVIQSKKIGGGWLYRLAAKVI